MGDLFPDSGPVFSGLMQRRSNLQFVLANGCISLAYSVMLNS